MNTSGTVRCLGLILTLASIVLLAATGCQQPASAPRVPTVTASTNPFAGDEACRECHLREFKTHASSGHKLTLRLVNPAAMGADTPPTGPVPGTKYVVRNEGGRYTLQDTRRPERIRPLELAFGAGRTGITFIAYETDTSFRRLRVSWFPRLKRWHITPGMEDVGDDDPASRLRDEPARGCILCHAVYLPPKSAKVEPKYLGVGCESCHGAGRAHIEAARIEGNRNLGMARLKDWTALQINDRCGNCHSAQTEEMASPTAKDERPRFQVNGILYSKCFERSVGGLSCITCHDAHAAIEKNPKTYEAACLKCHTPGAMIQHRDPESGKGPPCPVNPRNGCIPCHMPAKRIFPHSVIPTRMTDHLIRIHPELR